MATTTVTVQETGMSTSHSVACFNLRRPASGDL